MKRILFLSVANSARSQVAEGLARRLFGDGVRVQSAGAFPSQIDPLALEVMKELGLDISDQRSKPLDSIDPASVDTIITLCHEGVCPSSLWRLWHYHWPIPNPAEPDGLPWEQQLERFRAVRDGLQRRLERLKGEVPEG